MSPTGASASAIRHAAENLLAALPADQRTALRFEFADSERQVWHYTPGPRPGVSLSEMDRDAAKAVHQLLATVVSKAAHTQVAAIAGLEDILDESEGGRQGRHAGDYWTALFGDPGAPAWGWRFEGHHVSINVTVVGLAAHTGLPVTALRPAQVSLLRSLAALYVSRLTGELAEPILAEVDRDLPAFCFAWAGPAVFAAGQPHYYRLVGPRFLVEFDNRHNRANHIHSVWRQPGGDFGARLLPGGARHLS